MREPGFAQRRTAKDHKPRGVNGTNISRPTDREGSDSDSDIIFGYPAIFRISRYEFGYFIRISDTDTIWVISVGYRISGRIIRIGDSDIKFG